MTSLYSDGNIYDRIFHAGHDLDFWVALARESHSVLELACGTGRVAIPIAQASVEIVGLDASQAMLTEAREKAKTAGVDIPWLQADMCCFNLDRKFGLVILANNSLCHLHGFQQLEQCLACVHRHLETGGRFVIDVFVPNMPILMKGPDQRSTLSRFPAPDGSGEVVVTARNRYEADTQINRVETFITGPDGAEETGTLDMRMYFPQELEALLHYNGFQVEHRYGDFNRTAFGPDAAKQILVCKARAY